MNNSIERAFANGKAFIPFITAGDPDLDTTERLICAMAENGADLIEIGIPFSDPVAEGPVIQRASERALATGITTDDIMDMVESVRKKTDVPLAFMTYINLIFTYGADRFMKRCKELDIAAVIIPDIPYEEKAELTPSCKKYGIKLISLIAPTSKDRIKMIAKEAEGFIYCVSSMGVTGMRSEMNKHISEMIDSVKEVNDIPCAVGFGVSTPEQAAEYAKYADGVIVGSAVVKIVEQHGKDSIEYVADYVSSMKQAIVRAERATA